MLQYEKIDISEGIDFDKTNKSAECMICHYWYFKDLGFKDQPYVRNECHEFSMNVQNLGDFAILRIKRMVNMSKKDAISLLNNSALDNKGVL